MTVKYIFSQKQINCIALLLIGIMMIFVLSSGWSIKQSVRKEQGSESVQLKFQRSSQTLSDTSDYLTDEVRKFVVTGELKYMKNYWQEVREKKTREAAIASFQSSDIPSRELQLLKTAKNNSDLLILTEIRAMKLAAVSYNIQKNRLDPSVRGYVLNVEDKQLGQAEAGRRAAELVFGTEYESEKSVILSAISEFQQHLDRRLRKNLYEARKQTGRTVEYQAAALSAAFSFISAVLFSFYRFSVSPILEHTSRIRHMGEKRNKSLLTVKGTRELRIFAEKFNQVYDSFLKAGDEKSRFFSNISHEIRTPLNSIIGYEVLMRDTQLTERQEQYLDIMKDSSETLLNLINQILDISKVESGKMRIEEEHFKSRDFFSGILDMFLYGVKNKQVLLSLSVDDTVPDTLYADAGKLRQILLNLLSNSLKFTDEGEIHVQAGFRETVKDLPVLIVSVADTGCGIRREDLQRIFQAFEQSGETAGRLYGGTGLGLTISKSMAEVLGGKLTVQSKENKGSCFTLEIPVKKGKAPVSAGSEKNPWTAQGQALTLLQGKKVLLVEDNAVNQKMEAELLKKFGLHVTCASRGRDAIRMAQDEKYDMIFMDIRMKPLDGFQTAKEILYTTKNFDTFVAAMTADVESATIQRIFREGMKGFLPKPFSLAQLEKILLLSCRAGSDEVEKYQPVTESKNSLLNMEDRIEELGTSLYEQLLIMFLKQHQTEFSSLSPELSERQFLHLIHTLKGVSGNIGAEVLQHKLYLLEQKLKRADLKPNQTGSDISDIKLCYEKTRKEILKYLQDACQEEENVMEGFELDTFITYLRDADMEALEIYEKHTSQILNFVDPKQTKKFEASMECCDFIKAYECLEEGMMTDV